MPPFPCPGCGRLSVVGEGQCPLCKTSLLGPWFRSWPRGVRRLVVGVGGLAGLVLLALVILAITLPDKPTRATIPAVPQTAAPIAKDGRLTVQPGQWFGFRDRELLDRSTKLAAQGDKAAWATLMSQAAMAGKIIKFKAGEEVYHEESALLAGVVKVRRKGEAQSWWTNIEAVR